MIAIKNGARLRQLATRSISIPVKVRGFFLKRSHKYKSTPPQTSVYSSICILSETNNSKSSNDFSPYYLGGVCDCSCLLSARGVFILILYTHNQPAAKLAQNLKHMSNLPFHQVVCGWVRGSGKRKGKNIAGIYTNKNIVGSLFMLSLKVGPNLMIHFCCYWGR